VQPGRHWAYTSIETLYGHGLVAGVGGNRFAPNQPITHQQLGFLIHKAAPDLADTALQGIPSDRGPLERRELSRALYVLLKHRLGI
jgi:hypothetical protein